MAGKKAFDPQQVLEKAMNAFWERGYEGISIEDLVQCTGIGRGSLYDTFGDKHSLYLAALDRYLVSGQAQITALLNQAGTVQEVLEQLFQTYIDALLSDPNHRGCFLVNASLETAPRDPEVNQIVQSALQELEEGFYRLLIKGWPVTSPGRTIPINWLISCWGPSSAFVSWHVESLIGACSKMS